MNIGWVDLETTGLDVDNGCILEVGIIVTDGNLNEICKYDALVDNGFTVDALKAKCDDFVLNMHTKNGLFDALEAKRKLSIEQITTEVTQLLKDNDAFGGPMAGSSVGFDRKFIEKHMPGLAKCWSYRNLDVSAFKEWFKLSQGFQVEKPDSDHRVIGDIVASISEMKQYVGRSL